MAHAHLGLPGRCGRRPSRLLFGGLLLCCRRITTVGVCGCWAWSRRPRPPAGERSPPEPSPGLPPLPPAPPLPADPESGPLATIGIALMTKCCCPSDQALDVTQ